MGSPLGVLFANFFMGSIEEEVFGRNYNLPDIYWCYVDDIFIKTQSLNEIEILRSNLQEASGLTFTIENSNEGSMPFLDILATQQTDSFSTKVYT